jgi:hypothetical protein
MDTLIAWFQSHLKLLGSVPLLAIAAWVWHMLLPNLWPVAFYILDSPVALRQSDPGGVYFRVRLRVKRRTDEDIEKVRARVDERWLDLLEDWQQPQQGRVCLVSPIFGSAPSGTYEDKTLEVVMEGRWRRGKWAIVKKAKIQESLPHLV